MPADNASNPLRHRLRVWREVAWSRWKAIVLILYGVVCAAEFARDHFASDALKAKLHFVPNLTWQGWTIGALSLLVVATLEGAYHAVLARENSLDSKRQALARTGSSEDSWQSEFIVLAGQLRHFLDARSADYAAEFGSGFQTSHEHFLDMQEIASGDTGKRARKTAAMKTKHHASTLQMYGDQFASRVLNANSKSLELGVDHMTVSHLDKYPTNVAGIEAIITELEARADAGKQSRAAKPTPEEEYWNERRAIEAPERVRQFTASQRAAPSEPKPYLAIDYVSVWGNYVLAGDPDEQVYSSFEESLKFANASAEVMRHVRVASFSVWGVEMHVEPVPTLIHGEPETRRVGRIKEQFDKANTDLRVFRQKELGVPLTVTYYGQSDDGLPYSVQHALVCNRKGAIRVEPLIGDTATDWLDVSEIPELPGGRGDGE